MSSTLKDFKFNILFYELKKNNTELIKRIILKYFILMIISNIQQEIFVYKNLAYI